MMPSALAATSSEAAAEAILCDQSRRGEGGDGGGAASSKRMPPVGVDKVTTAAFRFGLGWRPQLCELPKNVIAFGSRECVCDAAAKVRGSVRIPLRSSTAASPQDGPSGWAWSVHSAFTAQISSRNRRGSAEVICSASPIFDLRDRYLPIRGRHWRCDPRAEIV